MYVAMEYHKIISITQNGQIENIYLKIECHGVLLRKEN